MDKKVYRKSIIYYKTHKNHQSYEIKIKQSLQIWSLSAKICKQALIPDEKSKDHLWEEAIRQK